MNELFQDLQSRPLDLISVKSNSSQFYTSVKDSNFFRRKKRNLYTNQSIQINRSEQSKNSLKSINQRNIKKDVCGKRDFNKTQTNFKPDEEKEQKFKSDEEKNSKFKNHFREMYKNTNDNQERKLENQYEITQKQLETLIQNYPNVDLNNLDNQNLDYIAHLLCICQCYKCECNTCKCPYMVNHIKYKYNFHDLQTSNSVNHNLNQKIQTDLDVKIPYENNNQKEQIIQNTIYKKDYENRKQPEQFQNFKHQKASLPFVNVTTNQVFYPYWKKQRPDILKNLSQLNVLKSFNPYTHSSSYTNAYQQINVKPDLSKPRQYNPDDKQQPFQYQSQNDLTYQGEFNNKAKPYSFKHQILQSKQIPQHYTSINQKMNSDLNFGGEKLCPQKQFDRESLKEQLLMHLQN